HIAGQNRSASACLRCDYSFRGNLSDTLVQHLQTARPGYIALAAVAVACDHLQRDLLVRLNGARSWKALDGLQHRVVRPRWRRACGKPGDQQTIRRRIYSEAPAASVWNSERRLAQDQALCDIGEIDTPSLDILDDRVIVSVNVEAQQRQLES